MAEANSFKDLIVWQKSMDLVQESYRIIDILPKRETYALGNQITRCATSIPSNIAEGYRRNSRKEYLQYLGIASGSAAELETQLIIVARVYGGMVNSEYALDLVTQVQKMLYALIMRLKTKP